MLNNSGTAEPTLVCCEPTKTDKIRQKPIKTDKGSVKSGATTAVPAVPGASCLYYIIAYVCDFGIIIKCHKSRSTVRSILLGRSKDS